MADDKRLPARSYRFPDRTREIVEALRARITPGVTLPATQVWVHLAEMGWEKYGVGKDVKTPADKPKRKGKSK